MISVVFNTESYSSSGTPHRVCFSFACLQPFKTPKGLVSLKGRVTLYGVPIFKTEANAPSEGKTGLAIRSTKAHRYMRLELLKRSWCLSGVRMVWKIGRACLSSRKVNDNAHQARLSPNRVSTDIFSLFPIDRYSVNAQSCLQSIIIRSGKILFWTFISYSLWQSQLLSSSSLH